MDLAKLEIALRPRNHWEAIDLGFALARRWFLPLSALWLMTALPFTLLLALLFHDDMSIFYLLVWWFKPMYEPPLMFWLSRCVFGERPTLKSVRRHWWRIVRPQLLANLSWRRLSPNRSFYMPVALLEGLKGKSRKQRITVLGRRQHAGTWLTFAGIHFELILELCFIGALYFLIPEELRWFEGTDFFLSPGPIDEWLQLLCWLAAMAIIAPFYVAGGFALYLHRRSELEGWDIEINFRRTVENAAAKSRTLPAAAASVLLCLSLAISTPHEAIAADNPGPEQSKHTIEQVLEDPHFGQPEEQTYWRYVGSDKPDTEEDDSSALSDFFDFIGRVIGGFIKGIASAGELLLWGLVFLVIAYLLYHFSRNRGWLQGRHSASANERNRHRPTELFGLDVRPDSLPDDIAGEALKLTQNGQLRDALSLLYRGTLIRLVAEYQLDIPESATEGECLELVRQARQEKEANYFRALTQAWLVTAYAHRHTDAHNIEQLCHDWQEVYGHA